MDLRQLEILRAVADAGSFTRAGRQLLLSQSAVSRQILLLEEELNQEVFTRIGRRIVITPTGETMLRLSQRVLDDLQETRASILDSQQELTGTLHLLGGMTVCLYVFPALLKQFRRVHPRVEVKVGTGPTGQLLEKLRSGGADLALLTLPIDDRTLVAEPVVREELMIVAASSHPLARRKRVGPEDLARLPFVLYEPGSNTRRVIDEFFVKEQIEPTIVTETENVEIIKALVRIGLGVTIIPYQAVAREVRGGYLFCARISGRQLVRETGWVYRRSARVPRTIQEMMRTLDRVVPRLKLAPPPARVRSTPAQP